MTGRRSPSLAKLAALVLAMHAWVLLVPPAHALAEAHHAHAEAPAGGAAAIQASCDPGCTLPGHAHHVHDPAHCASCRTLDGMLAIPDAMAADAALTGGALRLPHAGCSVHVGARLLPASRGPPALSFPS